MIEDLIDFEMEHFSLALGFDLIIRGKASKFFFFAVLVFQDLIALAVDTVSCS